MNLPVYQVETTTQRQITNDVPRNKNNCKKTIPYILVYKSFPRLRFSPHHWFSIQFELGLAFFIQFLNVWIPYVVQKSYLKEKERDPEVTLLPLTPESLFPLWKTVFICVLTFWSVSLKRNKRKWVYYYCSSFATKRKWNTGLPFAFFS